MREEIRELNAEEMESTGGSRNPWWWRLNPINAIINTWEVINTNEDGTGTYPGYPAF